MIEGLLAIILMIAVAAAIYYFLRKALILVINAVVGLITLWLLNYLDVMSWFSAPEIPINLVTVLICALGGLPGALLLVLLNLVGITV
jgi:pro-sigmaK processing inhibitor BofA